MTDKPILEERENGPLVVKGVTSMTGPDGAAIDCKPVMALCRCGGSGNKPFCDGSHKTNGFQGRGGTPAGRDRLIAYEGTAMTVTFNPRLCSHAAECAAASATAFDATRRPWIEPDADSAQAIETAVRNCPSGALRIAGRETPLPDRPQVTVQRNGPYWLLGVAFDGASAGEGASAEKMALCRCGLSGNKPFCDGSHRDAGWTDS